MGSFRLLRGGETLGPPPAGETPPEVTTTTPEQQSQNADYPQLGRKIPPDAPPQEESFPPRVNAAELKSSAARKSPFVMSFVLSVLKARVQGITKYASFVILVDHDRKTHTITTKLGAPGAVYFEPTDGSALRFHFGPPGPSRPGPPEAWSVAGGMGVYQLNIDTSRQIAMVLRQLDAPAVLVGSRPEIDDDLEDDEDTPARGEQPSRDGIMRYLGEDEMAYYAFPAMTLDGVLGVGSDEQAITGRAWMEHQWGDFPLGEYRWKYVAVDLACDSSDERFQLIVFLYARRGCDDATRKQHSNRGEVYGLWIKADGTAIRLPKLKIRHRGSKDFGNYHVDTHILHEGEEPLLDLRVEPYFPDQDCRTEIPRSIFPTFWEGACTVSGTVGKLTVNKNDSWAITELAGQE
jgi:hypothetical protein